MIQRTSRDPVVMNSCVLKLCLMALVKVMNRTLVAINRSTHNPSIVRDGLLRLENHSFRLGKSDDSHVGRNHRFNGIFENVVFPLEYV